MSAVKRREHILVVVDPYAEDHPVVDRAVDLAKRLGMGIDLFSCYYEPPLASEVTAAFLPYTDNCEATLKQQLDLLHDLAKPYEKENIDITIKAAWDSPMCEGIVREVLRSTPRFVMKETHYHSAISRALFTNTDWQLTRHCPVPVWLVRADGDLSEPTIMAAVDPANFADTDASLDTLILSEAFDLTRQLGGTVHVVHAFDTAPHIAAASTSIVSVSAINVDKIIEKAEAIHTAALAELTIRFTIPDAQVHMPNGKATDLLPYMARELSAKLVIMGAVNRSRLEHIVIGSTAERVLDHLPCDVLIIKPAGFVSPVTLESVPGSYMKVEQEHIFKIAA
jgi:universal stress protein E